MSRFKSPQTAAKEAQRTAKEAEQRRRVKRNSLFMIIGFVVVSISLVIGDYFLVRARAQKRREQHMQSRHRSTPTNDAAHVPNTGSTNSPQVP